MARSILDQPGPQKRFPGSIRSPRGSGYRIRHRPIFGGVFGEGRYSLATQPCVSRGLHAVRYLVIEPRAGRVLSIRHDKREALSAARELLGTGEGAQASLWPELAALGRRPRARPNKVPRRRREIFNRSRGRCFYCADPLQLEGHWHVEHQLPRALGGGNEVGNLVAACAPCNLSKGPRSAIEFIAQENRA